MEDHTESALIELQVDCQIAHQRYMQAQERGAGQVELMRLWAQFMDASKAVKTAKAGAK